MARYKAITSEDGNQKLTKKRHRICTAVYCIYWLLLFTCILIAGINQHNSLVVGWILIGIGIISIPTATFHTYTTRKGWKPQLRAWADDNADVELETIMTIVFILFSVIPLLLGALKLFEII